MTKKEATSKIISVVKEGNEHYAQILLCKGANVNAKDKHGATSLIWAASKGNLNIVKRLLNKGAKLNIEDEEGYTALMYAEEQGYNEIADVLKEKELRNNGIYLSNANKKMSSNWQIQKSL